MMWKGWDPNPTRTGILRGRDTRELFLLTHSGRDIWKHNVEAATCKSEREVSPETKLPDTRLGTFSFQNCEKMNVCCFSHPVYGVLYRNPSIVIHTHKNTCVYVCTYECVHINVCVNVWFCVTRKNFSSFLK